jgi:putative membrane protein
MRILLSIVFNAVALYATALVVPGISFRGNLVSLLVAGAIFGLFNLIVRPVALLLSLPLLIVTLGLFYFVLNGILLWVASFFLPGYNVAGIVPGIVGSLVFAIVNWALNALFTPKD